ncbi:MAG: efflux RND transporter periplasmic adaptor subunit [Alcanivoracaceae bacterium]|nr:efflux RND transporter periplasmic adaptor subunit [Alcanivoracaceae bacterium]
MARLIIFVFTVVLILSLASCGREAAGDSSATKDASKKAQVDKKANRKKGKRTGRGKGKDSDEPVIINVEAENVQRGNAISVFKTTTILEADLESAVTSKASGIVLKINVEVGDKVVEGDVLAILESDLQQLGLQSASANYQKSLHNYDRAKVLLKKGLANKESVDNLKFETRSLKTNLDQAKMDLDFTRIKAPISGVITKRSIKKGNLIQLNTAVYEIVDFDSLQAVINVPENKWGLFENNLEVVFDFASFDKPVTGRILRMDPVVDSSTGTFRVVIAIDDHQAKLRPGLFGKTQIVLDKRQDVLLVTKNAVIREDDKSFVYVINADRSVIKTTIQLGYEMDESIEILAGLEESQQVITTGKNNVSEESIVEVIEYND